FNLPSQFFNMDKSPLLLATSNKKASEEALHNYSFPVNPDVPTVPGQSGRSGVYGVPPFVDRHFRHRSASSGYPSASRMPPLYWHYHILRLLRGCSSAP